MADVNINKFRASVVRDGSKPASPGFIVSEGQDPVNPPGTNNYVPYSGATANVELGEYGVEAGFITLDTTPTNTPTDQGTIFWDADDETVDIVLNGYTMKIGEDLFYPVKNQTGSTIAKGVAVRFNGTVGNSGRLLIAPFIADGSVPSTRFMGVTAEEILNGEDGKVLYFGRVRGINTNAFNEGDILYASTTVAGGYQTAIPVAPNNIVQVAAVVTKSATVGTIFVRPTLGSNINKDEGVKITSVADKNLLQYQSGTSLWENKSLAQVLGGTSAQFVKGDGSLDSTTYGTGTVTSVGLSSATSGVTIGSTPVTTSGTITLAIATASGSQNGLLSSTDWTTFNNKQNALTNPVTGTGTTNYLPKFTGSTTIGNSNLINDASGNLGLGVTPSAWMGGSAALQVIRGGLWHDGSGYISLFNNAYYDGSNWRYIASTWGTNFAQVNGNFQWFQASSGTAGNAISFTQAMTLDSSGRLGVGTGSSSLNNHITFTQTIGGSPANLSELEPFATVKIKGRPDRNNIVYIGALDALTGMIIQSGTTSTAAPLAIQPFGGNLLVGTSSDNGARLQVSGTATLTGNTNGEFAINSTNSNSGSDAATLINLTNNSSVAQFVYTSSTYSGAYDFGANSLAFINRASGSINFVTAGFNSSALRMRITSSGNVGIGTASPLSKLQVDGEARIVYSKAVASNPLDVSSFSGLVTLNTNNVNGSLSGLAMYANSDYNAAAGIFAIRTSGISADLVFYAGSATASERMRITSGGNVLIGTTTDAGYKLNVNGTGRFKIDGLSIFGFDILNNAGTRGAGFYNTGGNNVQLYFYNSAGVEKIFLDGGSGAATFSSSVTATSFITSSDLRLKEVIEKDGDLAVYKRKGEEQIHYGYIAQEMQESYPNQVHEAQDGYLSLNYVEILVKKVNELEKKIKQLEK